MPRARTAGVFLVAALASSPAHAQDAFEIQVYDAETAPPLHAGIEIHANYNIVGVREGGPGEVLPTDHVFHLTFEPHYGIAPWGEIGAYIQSALLPDGSYHYAGFKGRFKVRVPRRLAGLVGLALNVELSLLPPAYSESPLGGELRPIVDVRWRFLYLALNPILSFDLQGPLAGRPQLEPAAKLAFGMLSNRLALGVEYYGAVGPVYAPLPASQEVHRLFGAADVDVETRWVHFTLNLGVGYGFLAGEKWMVKTILGFDLER